MNSHTMDRRESTRFRADPGIAYICLSPDHRIEATILDESEGGIGIIVGERKPFKMDLTVRVDIAGEQRDALIVYIVDTDSNAIRIGLAWV